MFLQVPPRPCPIYIPNNSCFENKMLHFKSPTVKAGLLGADICINIQNFRERNLKETGFFFYIQRELADQKLKMAKHWHVIVIFPT